MFENSKVLVAGATGLVGTAIVKRLLGYGAKVRATMHSSSLNVRHEQVEYIFSDLTRRPDCIRAIADMDYVFLMSASTSGAAAISSTPMIHVTPNVLMNTQILDAAYNAGVKKVVWLASTTGYPDSGDELVKEDDMFKGEPYDKYFFVGWMKRFTEKLCEMYSNRLPNPMPCIVLRPTNIYGPHDKFDPARSHVLPALIRKAVNRQDPFEVWGDGRDVRDFIYIDDMVDAIMLAMEKVDRYDPINIGSGETYSVREILKIILDHEQFQPIINYDLSKPSMIPIRKVDVEKAKQLLGFEPQVNIGEGVARTIQWYRQSNSQ